MVCETSNIFNTNSRMQKAHPITWVDQKCHPWYNHVSTLLSTCYSYTLDVDQDYLLDIYVCTHAPGVMCMRQIPPVL